MGPPALGTATLGVWGASCHVISHHTVPAQHADPTFSAAASPGPGWALAAGWGHTMGCPHRPSVPSLRVPRSCWAATGHRGAALISPMCHRHDEDTCHAPVASSYTDKEDPTASLQPVVRNLTGARRRKNKSKSVWLQPPLHSCRNQSSIWEYLPLSLEMETSR